MKGIDYAFYPHPSTAAIKAAGANFVCRYISSYAPNDSNGKNLLPAEKTALLKAGISVVVVAEQYSASRMLNGYPAGVADAQHADAVVKALDMTGIPVYFAADWDSTEAEQTAINAYLDGCASVIGLARNGIYGGYWPLKRAFDAGKVTWGWQTYAWSGRPTLWDNRAQLRQVQNGVTIGGADCDIDTSMAADFGQWPRPGSPPPPPDVPAWPYADTDYLGVTSADPHCHSGYNPADRAPITVWQTQMRRRGWPITVDGRYGLQSASICRSFQAEKGLTVDGKVGPVTWGASWTAPVT